MAKDKKGFMLYADQKELFEQISDEKAGQLIKHILNYVNDENPVTDDLIINLAFTPIKQQLKRDLKKWEQRADISRKNGKLGGRPKNLKEPRKPNGFKNNPGEPRKPDTVTVNVTDKDINNIEQRKAEFKELIRNNKKQYKVDMLRDFFEYWSEHGEKDKNMRYEKQTSFSVARRLGTWKKNAREFNKPKNTQVL